MKLDGFMAGIGCTVSSLRNCEKFCDLATQVKNAILTNGLPSFARNGELLGSCIGEYTHDT